jgi:dihydrofolate reductase
MTARLLYVANVSVDGYLEDAQGKFDFARPDEEVHQFINDLIRPAGTYLYGRRMYETMRVWESQYGGESDPPVARDFAKLWRSADKIVFSTTLKDVSTRRTRLERIFDVGAVREIKTRATRDLTIGGPGLAAHAFRAGLVDEIHLFLWPSIVGGGKPALPKEVRVNLKLIDERRFERSSVVYLRHAAR